MDNTCVFELRPDNQERVFDLLNNYNIDSDDLFNLLVWWCYRSRPFLDFLKRRTAKQ